MLECGDDIPTASPTPKEEAALLDEPQVTATSPALCDEKSPKPEDVAGPEETATGPQGVQVHLPLPPGFGPLPAEPEPPLLKKHEILIRVPNLEGEAWPTLMPKGAMNFIVFRNECTIEYEYETHILESLGLNLADSRQKSLNCDLSR